jgi:hypothetical protein
MIPLTARLHGGSKGVLTTHGPWLVGATDECKFLEVALQQVVGSYAANGGLIVGNLRQAEIGEMAEDLHGSDSRLPDLFREGCILDVEQYAVATPVRQPVAVVGAGGARVDKQRPGPDRLHVARHAPQDATSVAGGAVHTDGNVRYPAWTAHDGRMYAVSIFFARIFMARSPAERYHRYYTVKILWPLQRQPEPNSKP